jgi:hypothetical protein
MIENIKTISIVILLFLIGFFVLNENKKIQYRDRIKYDTIRLKSIVEVKSKPKIIKERVEVPVYDTIRLTKRDTIEIVADWMTKREYSDTIISGNNKVIIDDTVYKNKIVGRNVRLELENIIIKPVKVKNQTQLWINPIYGNSFGCNIMLIRGKVGLSSGYNNGLNIGVLLRLK